MVRKTPQVDSKTAQNGSGALKKSEGLQEKAKVGSESATRVAKLSSQSAGSSHLLLKVIIAVLAFATRFWIIDKPSEVVFDEVHFGKFASHYLQQEYYFDLHPPFGKLLFALVGYLVNHDGSFKFDEIGDSYIANAVPYVAYRSLAATLGAATVPLVFAILEQVGCSAAACTLGASLVLFDTAQIAQTRLILLDASLIFWLVLSVYCYIRFTKCRNTPFSVKWWAWLLITGFSMSCSISTKYVGLFVFLTVGSAVIVDLYNLYDVHHTKSPLSLCTCLKHFLARAFGLIAWPFTLYLFWFYVHFRILSHSGPGDAEMSPEFQKTLKENPLAKDALDINLYDVVTIQSVPKNVYLHSHPDRYPLRYEDGRISTQGQQVTGYTHPDLNNHWQILPAEDMAPGDDINYGLQGYRLIRLRHVATDTYLLTHDVASPGFPTNEEFTTVPAELALGERYADTLFLLDVVSGQTDQVQTKMSRFRLKHDTTKVSMWLSDGPLLPDWGYGQYEVNGNKQLEATGSVWCFGDVIGLTDEEIEERKDLIGDEPVEVPRRPFYKDYLELQGRMFTSNNLLTASHPYMSSPLEWPLMLRGISFWTGKDGKSQIYLVGNYIGWFLEIFGYILTAIIIALDQLTYLRDAALLTPFERQKLYRTALWFLAGWAFHYFPFFLMGRQLFLHHYLPAHIMGALVLPTSWDILFGQFDKSRRKHGSIFKLVANIAVTAMILGLIWGFLFFGPLAYGLPLSPERVRAREWFNITLHFNKNV